MYKKKSYGWSQHPDFIILDILVFEISLLISYYIVGGMQGISFTRTLREELILILFIDLIILVLSDGYRDVIRRTFLKEFPNMLRHTAFISLTWIMSMAFLKIETGSLILVAYTIAIYFVLCLIVRTLWKRHLRARLNIDIHRQRRMLVVTETGRIRGLIEELMKNNFNSYRFVGVALMDDDSSLEKGNEQLTAFGEYQPQDMRVVATRDTLISYLKENIVDEIYFDITDWNRLQDELVGTINSMGLTIHFSLDGLNFLNARNKNIERVLGNVVVTTSLGYVSGRELFLKRLIDIFGGIIGCVFTGLLTLILGPAIYIASPGPIFFKQTRIGENGRKFQLYKFRSMVLNAEQQKKEVQEAEGQSDSLMFKAEHDPRIIGQKQLPNGKWKKGIGGVIRDLSLDEFPQFWNVLRGDMSLVGTRPPTLDEWERYTPFYHSRMSTKPGITGLWQVSGRSNIRDFDQVVELDREYIENWSLGLDFQILLRTVWVVLTRKGAM